MDVILVIDNGCDAFSSRRDDCLPVSIISAARSFEFTFKTIPKYGLSADSGETQPATGSSTVATRQLAAS